MVAFLSRGDELMLLVQPLPRMVKKSRKWWGDAPKFLSWKARIIMKNVLMITSSNGNIFHGTGPLWGESNGHRWIPLTKANDVDFLCFFFDLRLNKWLSKQSRHWWFETPLCSLWHHWNEWPFTFNWTQPTAVIENHVDCNHVDYNHVDCNDVHCFRGSQDCQFNSFYSINFLS